MLDIPGGKDEGIQSLSPKCHGQAKVGPIVGERRRYDALFKL